MYQLNNLIFMCLFCYNVLAEKDCNSNPTPKTETLRLKEDLLRDYDTTIRPVLHHDNQTLVYVTMFLWSVNFETYTNSIEIHCWMVWEWTDEHLQWKPSDYGSVDTLHVDSYDIWVPGISQFASSAAWEVEVRMPSGRCEVKASGNVKCVPSTVYFALCIPDLTYWPYDKVNCSLRLGAWMQRGEEVNLSILQENVDLLNYKPNREWNLLSATARRHVEVYMTNATFPWIQYSLLLQRHSSMYEATLGASAIMFATIVLTTFWLQYRGATRFNLSCVSLFCHYLHLQYLGWMLESSGDKCPLIVLFFRDSMLLSGLSLILAITLRCLTSTSAAPPAWVSGVTSYILSYRPGQLLLLSKMSPEDAASAREEETEEASVLVGAPPAEVADGWSLLATLLDRIGFFVFSLLYIFFFVRCFV